MDKIQERRLYEQFSEELKALCEDKQPVILVLTKAQAWILMCNLQLALRHPKNNGPTADTARNIAESIQKQVAISPALAEVARRGWERQYDVKPRRR